MFNVALSNFQFDVMNDSLYCFPFILTQRQLTLAAAKLFQPHYIMQFNKCDIHYLQYLYLLFFLSFSLPAQVNQQSHIDFDKRVLSFENSSIYMYLYFSFHFSLPAQVNPQMPRSFGDGAIHKSHIDCMVECDEPLPEMQPFHSTEIENKIGSFVAENLVMDGATLQMGK